MIISIDPDCKLLLYADDSTILFSLKDAAVISSKLGKVLELVQLGLLTTSYHYILEKLNQSYLALKGNLRRLNTKLFVMDILLNLQIK